jgi:glyoxylase-like metal-dependent hydrolase (beta-lactamase superfamily II)/8-oxo-dGTP pyrophosphatase MutT (NUDIX family)
VAPIRSAAAILWREGGEVYLARRVPRMRFFGNVHAFCGGRVDEVDGHIGPDLQSAIVRELIEELGIDLRAEGRPADPALRRGLVEGTADWAEECAAPELDALGDPALRLITPDFYPRRFDTFFFLARVRRDCDPDPLPEELETGGWDTPASWLERWHAGEFHLAAPVLLILRSLRDRPVEEWSGALERAQQRIEDPGRIQEIRLEPGVRLLPVRTPTIPPARHTNAYLVGHDPAWLVDPATPYPDAQAVLEATLRAAPGRIAGILLTHDHQDHVGAAGFVADRFELPTLAHEKTAARLGGRVRVDRFLEDGERLPLGHSDGAAGQLECVFTPGHAQGHLCFLEPRYGGLVCGDMVSTLSSILIDPDDGDMADYLASLERLAHMPIRTVYPAHGPPDSRGVRVIEDQIAHRRDRERAVLAAALAGPVSLDDLTAEVWGDVPRPMLAMARKSAVSILTMLGRQGQVRIDDTTVGPPHG